MPIRKAPSHLLRKSRGFVPLQFFAGRHEELRSLPVRDIVRAFGDAGQYISPEKAEQLKMEVLSVVPSPIQTQQKKLPRPSKRIRRLIAKGYASKMRPVKPVKPIKRVSFFSLPVGHGSEKDYWAGRVHFSATLFPNGKIFIHQEPLLHGVTGTGEKTPFDAMLKILTDGFKGYWTPNAYSLANRKSYARLTRGDSFTLQIMAARGSKHDAVNKPGEYYERPLFHSALGAFIKSAQPTQILAVNIVLDDGLSAQGMAEKKKFYRETLKPFGIPVHFLERQKTTPWHFEGLTFELEQSKPY